MFSDSRIRRSLFKTVSGRIKTFFCFQRSFAPFCNFRHVFSKCLYVLKHLETFFQVQKSVFWTIFDCCGFLLVQFDGPNRDAIIVSLLSLFFEKTFDEKCKHEFIDAFLVSLLSGFTPTWLDVLRDFLMLKFKAHSESIA